MRGRLVVGLYGRDAPKTGAPPGQRAGHATNWSRAGASIRLQNEIDACGPA